MEHFFRVKLTNGYVALQQRVTLLLSSTPQHARRDVPFDLQTALTAQGALFHVAAPWSANSLADGLLVTGQNPASAKGVGEKMVAILSK